MSLRELNQHMTGHPLPRAVGVVSQEPASSATKRDIGRTSVQMKVVQIRSGPGALGQKKRTFRDRIQARVVRASSVIKKDTGVVNARMTGRLRVQAEVGEVLVEVEDGVHEVVVREGRGEEALPSLSLEATVLQMSFKPQSVFQEPLYHKLSYCSYITS